MHEGAVMYSYWGFPIHDSALCGVFLGEGGRRNWGEGQRLTYYMVHMTYIRGFCVHQSI